MKKILFTLSLLLSLTLSAQTIAPGGIYQFKKSIDSTTFSTIGTVPFDLIAAPGTNKCISIIPGTLKIRRTGGTTSGYTFNVGVNVVITNGASVEYLVTDGASGKLLPSGTTTCSSYPDFSTSSNTSSGANSSIYISTTDSSDPTAGNNTIIITFLYTILNLN